MRLPQFEYVYCLFSLDFPYRGKVGYSKDVEQRRKSIEQSISATLGRSVRIYTVLRLPVLFAPTIERAIHNALKRFECRSMVGSGQTEWFWTLNVVTAVLIWLWCWSRGIVAPNTKALFALLIPAPVDQALYILVLALAQYAIILTALWGAAKAIGL